MIFRARSYLASALLLAGVAVSPGSASAAGFFEQLFGGVASPAPAPSYRYEPTPASVYPGGGYPAETHRRRKVVQQDDRPVLQKTTDLMRDKTLRAGDPVMMKDGIHIYSGPEDGHHNARQFVALDDAAHVSSKTRIALVAMDLTRRDPADLAPVSEGRSAVGETTSSGPHLSAGYKITDASGKSVRYVGP